MKRIHNLQNLFNRRRELRNNTTPQEVTLWSKLKNSQFGVKFRRQHGIGNYVADFYCPAKKLVIEIDGSQHFKEESKIYDKTRTQFIQAAGMKVLRFTNAEINTNIEGVIMKIQSEI